MSGESNKIVSFLRKVRLRELSEYSSNKPIWMNKHPFEVISVNKYSRHVCLCHDLGYKIHSVQLNQFFFYISFMFPTFWLKVIFVCWNFVSQPSKSWADSHCLLLFKTGWSLLLKWFSKGDFKVTVLTD